MNALTIALSKMKRPGSAKPAAPPNDLEDLISEFQAAETPAEKAEAFRAMVSAVRSAPED